MLFFNLHEGFIIFIKYACYKLCFESLLQHEVFLIVAVVMHVEFSALC